MQQSAGGVFDPGAEVAGPGVRRVQDRQIGRRRIGRDHEGREPAGSSHGATIGMRSRRAAARRRAWPHHGRAARSRPARRTVDRPRPAGRRKRQGASRRVGTRSTGHGHRVTADASRRARHGYDSSATPIRSASGRSRSVRARIYRAGQSSRRLVERVRDRRGAVPRRARTRHAAADGAGATSCVPPASISARPSNG